MTLRSIQGAHRGAQPWLAVATAAAALFAGWPAEAAPQRVRLSFTGDTDTTMTVAWNTDAPEETEVIYGTSPGNLTLSEPGSSFHNDAGLGYIHEVTLAGLDPDTTYFYQAGSGANGYSPEAFFTTAVSPHPDCGSFRAVFLGDNRPDPIFGGGENYDQILAQAMFHQPAFVAIGGDLVTDGDNIPGWIDFLNWSTDAASFVPVMPTLGNHDNGPGEGDDAYYNQLFALPISTGTYGSGTEDYYYYLYGNAVFVALSTESFSGGAIKFQTQADWLDEVLTQYPQRWKIVFLHKPVYTKQVFFDISHEPNEESQNAAFVPIFDKHHVDVVLTSHNHWYERFSPSACANQGNPGSDQPCPVPSFDQGTVYYVSGGAGAFTIPGWLCGAQAGREVCTGDHHYLVMDFDVETLTIDTWGAFPQDNQIIDTITITKPWVDCSEPVGGSGGGGSGPGGAGPGGSGTGNTGTGGSGTGAIGPGGSGTAAGGTGPVGGSGAALPGETDTDAGCSCRVGAAGSSAAHWTAGALFVALGLMARRRRRR